MPTLFIIGLLIFSFFAISYISQRLGLPSVLLFIIFGATSVYIYTTSESIHLAAEVGIVLLFFILGMEFPLIRIVGIAKTVWFAGLLDVVLNMGIVILIGLAFGLDFFAAVFIGGVAYATSSSITAKLLEEKKRLANVETEFILALLIFEDLVSPGLISFLSGINSGQMITIGLVLGIIAKMFLLTAGAALIGYYGFRKLSDFISEYIDQDFMPLLTVGLALLYAGFALFLGLSEILGAFLAGVMLSETGKSNELERLLLPIRDVALPFFFFWFGTTISFGEGVPLVYLLIALLLWSVVGKVIVGYWGGKVFGLSSRAAYRAGFSLVPRGEFSAIIASLAVPQLRIFSGVYIVFSAFIGVALFQTAPALAKWLQAKSSSPTKPDKPKKVAE